MRRVVYGSGAVITTDDVAAALVRLSSSVANMRSADVVSIPILASPDTETGTADMIIGAGIAIMSEPACRSGVEPDFSTGTTLLQMHCDYPHDRRNLADGVDDSYADAAPWDPDLDGY